MVKEVLHVIRSPNAHTVFHYIDLSLNYFSPILESSGVFIKNIECDIVRTNIRKADQLGEFPEKTQQAVEILFNYMEFLYSKKLDKDEIIPKLANFFSRGTKTIAVFKAPKGFLSDMTAKYAKNRFDIITFNI